METPQLDFLLGIGAVGGQILFLAVLLAFLFRRKNTFSARIVSLVGNFGLIIGFLLSFAGVIISLYYSEVLGIAPCGLCWLQRVFLYPQVVLFGIAIWKNERRMIADYAIGLSLVGGTIALYQHYLQMGGANKLIPCPLSLFADCSTPTLLQFGYITYPFLSLLSFGLIILSMLCIKKSENVTENNDVVHAKILLP